MAHDEPFGCSLSPIRVPFGAPSAPGGLYDIEVDEDILRDCLQYLESPVPAPAEGVKRTGSCVRIHISLSGTGGEFAVSNEAEDAQGAAMSPGAGKSATTTLHRSVVCLVSTESDRALSSTTDAIACTGGPSQEGRRWVYSPSDRYSVGPGVASQRTLQARAGTNTTATVTTY